MGRCKVNTDRLKSNCIDVELKQQSKHDMLNEVRLLKMLWAMM